MEIYDVDMAEMEKQRYDSIKASGKYAEIKILVGAEAEKSEDGTMSKTPFISTTMRDCSSEEVACLYVSLKAVLQSLRDKYPVECFLGDTIMETTNYGTIDLSEDLSKDEEE